MGGYGWNLLIFLAGLAIGCALGNQWIKMAYYLAQNKIRHLRHPHQIRPISLCRQDDKRCHCTSRARMNNNNNRCQKIKATVSPDPNTNASVNPQLITSRKRNGEFSPPAIITLSPFLSECWSVENSCPIITSFFVGLNRVVVDPPNFCSSSVSENPSGLARLILDTFCLPQPVGRCSL